MVRYFRGKRKLTGVGLRVTSYRERMLRGGLRFRPFEPAVLYKWRRIPGRQAQRTMAFFKGESTSNYVGYF